MGLIPSAFSELSTPEAVSVPRITLGSQLMTNQLTTCSYAVASTRCHANSLDSSRRVTILDDCKEWHKRIKPAVI
jgi:hypothetical protein